MSTSVATSDPAFPTAAEPKKKHGNARVFGKLKLALGFMVWGDEAGEPMEFADAARKANLSVRAMRLALERPHVIRYLSEQKQVFRKSVSATNISHLRKIRNASGNAMAQLGAIKLIEQMDERAPSSAGTQRNAAPGVVVIVNADRGTPVMGHQTLIEVNPLQSNDGVGHDE